ncbi:hypothetical protein M9434_002479 [Picochlorum sp. BPE23]|nr:hypothetical protein M9434_002479 [Picochlorum sp. BPE23]
MSKLTELPVQILAEDCKSYKYLTNLGMQPCPPLNYPDDGKAKNFNTLGFKNLTSYRPIYLQYFLLHGISVLWLDSDIVPKLDLFGFIPPGVDMVLVDDKSNDCHYSSHGKCSCFIFMNPRNASLRFLSKWIEIMPRHANDQPALNAALANLGHEDHLSLVMLPRYLFPNGRDYAKFLNSSAWIHANYRVGRKAKEEFLKIYGYLGQEFFLTRAELVC